MIIEEQFSEPYRQGFLHNTKQVRKNTTKFLKTDVDCQNRLQRLRSC